MGERQEVTSQLTHRDAGQTMKIADTILISVIELQKDDHLIRVHDEFLLAGFECAAKLGSAQRRLPTQLTTAVMSQIILSTQKNTNTNTQVMST